MLPNGEIVMSLDCKACSRKYTLTELELEKQCEVRGLLYILCQSCTGFVLECRWNSTKHKVDLVDLSSFGTLSVSSYHDEISLTTTEVLTDSDEDSESLCEDCLLTAPPPLLPVPSFSCAAPPNTPVQAPSPSQYELEREWRSICGGSPVPLPF